VKALTARETDRTAAGETGNPPAVNGFDMDQTDTQDTADDDRSTPRA